jgi:hypothetical protein
MNREDTNTEETEETNIEDIIRVANKIGYGKHAITDEFFMVAALAAAAEREACARLLDDQWFKTQSECAAAIRARGEK